MVAGAESVDEAVGGGLGGVARAGRMEAAQQLREIGVFMTEFAPATTV